MTLSIQSFTRKPETVEAVQVTEDNIHDVAEWCGGEVVVELRTGLLAIDTGEGGVALVGEWVTCDEHGFYESASAGFEHGWQPAIPSTAQVTEYQLSPLPATEGMAGAFLWNVSVKRYPNDLWVVSSMFETVDAASGEWVHAPRCPASYETAARAEWEATYSRPLDEALRLAEAAQWTLEVDGKTARDVLADRGEAGR